MFMARSGGSMTVEVGRTSAGHVGGFSDEQPVFRNRCHGISLYVESASRASRTRFILDLRMP